MTTSVEAAPRMGSSQSDLQAIARAAWSVPEDGAAAALTGFVVSDFSPLVAAVADRCLAAAGITEPLPVELGDGVAVVLVSARGDAATNAAVAAAVDQGRTAPPLLFFQSVPNAVVGHVARRWHLRGPVTCISPGGDPWGTALDVVEGLVADGDAHAALVVLVEPAADPALARADAVLLGGEALRSVTSGGTA